MPFIRSLSLTGFRNYDSRNFDPLDNGFVALCGPNGSGKTNCLEAISLLSPGKGLRQAAVTEMQAQGSSTGWAVSALIEDGDGDRIRLGVGQDPQNPDKKIIRADGTAVKNQAELGDILRSVWLTPQMDGLFLQPAGERRRFFDRLVACFDPAHTGRMTRYEKSVRDRLSLLKQQEEKGVQADPDWLDALETTMAESAMAIAAARQEMLAQLQSVLTTTDFAGFPVPVLHLQGEVEEMIQSQSALSAEDTMRASLKSWRRTDGKAGRTHYGIHRTDFTATYRDKNMPAHVCSTGEQKALLTTLILAHAVMIRARFGQAPLLLFDEIAAHFDEARRDALFDILGTIQTQIWLTGQTEAQFHPIRDRINLIRL